MTTSAAIALPPRDHNGPPEPTPFDQSRDEIEGLFLEGKNWLDGSGVTTQADADAVSKLLDMIRQAVARADERRKAENKPFDDGKAEVQSRYNLLIGDTKSSGKGKAVLAAECCKLAMVPFLKAQDEAKRAVAEAARIEAERKAQEAADAFRASHVHDLAAREDAERLAREADTAAKAATKAENDKAGAHGGRRAVTLRTVYRAEVTNPTEFARWAWQNRQDEVRGMFAGMAERLCASGVRTMIGVTVHETKVAQ